MIFSDEQLRQIHSALAAESCVDAAFVLGSAAHGRMRSDSDIDIAILPSSDGTLNGIDRVRLAMTLEEILGRQVDLGILDHSNLVYAKEAYLRGKRIYCRNAFHCGLFGASALGMYADLREARREVEHAYQTR